jgi:hypothetical protein
MADSEVHLLDDIAEDLLKSKLRKKRLLIAILLTVPQMGLLILVATRYVLFRGMYVNLLFVFPALNLFFHWRYRSPNPEKSK